MLSTRGQAHVNLHRLTLGAGAPTHDVNTSFARPGTSVGIWRHMRAISTAAGSSSSAVSVGRKSANDATASVETAALLDDTRRDFLERAAVARVRPAPLPLERTPARATAALAVAMQLEADAIAKR